MGYTPDQISMIDRDYASTFHALDALRSNLIFRFSPNLKNKRAQEYLQQGVCRRLKILQRTLNRIFEIFPVARTKKLTFDELTDIQINVHAFMLNVHGLLDNLAWVYVFEKSLEEKIGGRTGVDLFKKKTQSHLPASLRTYLTSSPISEWHAQYAKIFRDALAHRIPLYIPPSIMTHAEGARYKQLELEYHQAIAEANVDLASKIMDEQEALGSICGMFNHSFSDPDSKGPAYLHPQMIADARTVIEVSGKVRDAFKESV